MEVSLHPQEVPLGILPYSDCLQASLPIPPKSLGQTPPPYILGKYGGKHQKRNLIPKRGYGSHATAISSERLSSEKQAMERRVDQWPAFVKITSGPA